MMPVARRPAPTSKTLQGCISAYLAKLTPRDARNVWDNFRKSKCGARWVLELQKAYGERCVYCDHSPGRTIDHRVAKTRKVEMTLAWSNWCPSCGDCNRFKNNRAVIDPLREDPRSFIVFDVLTGAPEGNSSGGARRRKKGEDTIGRLRLNQQTFNDSRRSKAERVLAIFTFFVQRKRGYDEARVFAELEAVEPHRAIIRDMILDADLYPSLAPLVHKAVAMLPHLRTWAEAPLQPRVAPQNAPKRRKLLPANR